MKRSRFTLGEEMEIIHKGPVICLRGWHPAISREEAYSMFPDVKISRTDARRLLSVVGDSDWSRCDIMSGSECILTEGGLAKWTTLEDFIANISASKAIDMAVECWRHEGKIDVSTKEIEQRVGGLFHDSGSTFNLSNPKNRFGIVLDASANYVAWGWMTGPGPGKNGWATMRANKRPFFRPVSLEPRLARAAVNIAAGIKSGIVVDPMCGTGGIIIEAGLSNRPSLGIDFDPEMVIGSKQNIEWANVDAEIIRDDSTRCKFPNDTVAVVVDPPYGRNSKGDALVLENTLKNLQSQIPNCEVVIILPTEEKQANIDEDIDFEISIPSLSIRSAYAIPVHKSLGRIMIIASVSPQE